LLISHRRASPTLVVKLGGADLNSRRDFHENVTSYLSFPAHVSAGRGSSEFLPVRRQLLLLAILRDFAADGKRLAAPPSLAFLKQVFSTKVASITGEELI
jgi:hypothetical protein